MLKLPFTWEAMEPLITELENYEWNSLGDFENWLEKKSSLEAYIGEQANWSQIHISKDTSNEDYIQAYHYFSTILQPKLESCFFRLNQKLVSSKYKDNLNAKYFQHYFQKLHLRLALYCEANIPLQTEVALLCQDYQTTMSALTITFENKDYTLSMAQKFLEQKNRSIRQDVYLKMVLSRAQVAQSVEQIFVKLLVLRNKLAENCGFANYRDYKFVELGRTDYSVADCKNFHKAIQTIVLPIQNDMYKLRQMRLGVEKLMPYDLDLSIWVDSITYFNTIDDLVSNTKLVLKAIDSRFLDFFTLLEDAQRLDLESRKNKAPGGFNCPLPESKIPFIFMNASGSITDFVTLLHESGHAFHNILCFDLPYSGLKDYGMEIAELASMSIELISSSYWHLVINDEKTLLASKIILFERVVQSLISIAMVDAFQHKIYENQSCLQPQDLGRIWQDLVYEYKSQSICFEGFESYIPMGWHKILHIFEVPFYYIEYGIAQLGAVQLWKQHQINPSQTIQNLVSALKLGGTQSTKDLYCTAGVSFDFSEDTIKDAMDMVHNELVCLYNQIKSYV